MNDVGMEIALTEECNELVGLLKYGLRKFYEHDAKLLFGNSDEKKKDVKDIDERAMVGCVYRYMYMKMSDDPRDSKWKHIDIEYDRTNLDGVETEKAIIACEKCVHYDVHDGYEDCLSYAKHVKEEVCGQCSVKDREGLRPDIIVHTRKSSENGLVVEFKKLQNDGRYDEAKLKYATCQSSPLHYTIGAFVQLLKDRARVVLYSNGVTFGEAFDVSTTIDESI